MMNFVTLKKMSKKIIFGFVLAAMFAFTADAQKIALVDVNKILDSMNDYKTAQTSLDNTAAKWRREIAEQYDEIKGMYNKYQAEQVLLSDEVRRQREDEITKKEDQVRQTQKDKFGPEGALFKKRQELVRPIQERVYTAIEDYANDKGYDFIFDKGSSSGMIFSNARYDKTEDVMKELGL
ncbi:MAG: outer membrane protein [Saprospiraceae bacterium]|jgi:outer membrane protein